MNNGYVSQSLRTVQISIKSQGDWIGEELFLSGEEAIEAFAYSVVPISSSLTVYQIDKADL